MTSSSYDKGYDDAKKYYKAEIAGYIVLSIFVTALVVLLTVAMLEAGDIEISQTTANKICLEFTGKVGVEGHSERGKLICEIPNYDSTLNIQVREAG